MLTTPSIICSLISMIFTFLGAVVFGLQAIHTDEEIDGMAGMYYHNRYLEKALKSERKSAWVGLFFLSLGLGFQIISFYFGEYKVPDF